MFRQILIVFLMGILWMGAAATGTSFPVLLLMGSLIFVALAESSTRNEEQE